MNAFRLIIPKEISAAELAAAFLSALAYPHDTINRNQFAAAMLGAFRDDDLKQGKETPLGIGWLLTQIDRNKLNRALEVGFKKINRERLIAAKMAFPRVHALFCDVAEVSRPQNVPMPTSAEMIAAIGIDLDGKKSNRGRKPTGNASEGNKGNIVERQWKTSLPSLHLALSFHYECFEPTAPVDGLSLGALLFDAELCERLIRRSITLRGVVRDIFRLDQTEQFQFIYSN